MAIKLVNALHNFRVEDNEVEIQKIISFLINNCGYKESQIDASLIIQDEDYISIMENHYGDFSISKALASLPALEPIRYYYELREETINELIPNREPPHYTKYSAVAKKLMLREENNDLASLRMRLIKLFTEQKDWQKQLQEVAGNMTLDDVRNQIKKANEKIAKHQDIIVKCEEFKRENKRWIEQLWNADPEYTTIEVEKGWDGEPIDSVGVYSVKHSQKRIAFWEDEIAKCEQKLQMMEIAQQQLTQVTQDIADVNEQIKNAAMRPVSEPLVEETSNKIDNVFISENNRLRKDWIYTDKATSEDKERFEKHIEYLCRKKISAQHIKRYIKEQENDSILEHIDFTTQYEILKEIGVDFKKKTFLNA